MSDDGMLQEWGTRLFYGMPKKPKQQNSQMPVVAATATALSADAVRQRIKEAVRSGGRQVVVKITGGGRGMKAIAAHMRYVSRQGKPEVGGRGQSLELEDENGDKISGAAAIKDLQSDWQLAGSYVPDESRRREAFNIMLSMPEGTPAEHVRDAARAFARETFEGYKYVFVLHEDTASPHVHLTVRAERRDGYRLNPRKADLERWRERFAARLQDRGVNAVATRAATRGVMRAPRPLWHIRSDGERVRKPRPPMRSEASIRLARGQAIEAWGHVAKALAASPDRQDRELAGQVVRFVGQHFGKRTPELLPERRPRRGDIEPSRD